MSLRILWTVVFMTMSATAAEEPALAPTAVRLAKDARPGLVSIFPGGRDGRTAGVGSGFVVDSGGLIATNFHVIGEARPLEVQLSDGRNLPVTGIHAWDRAKDLAVIRVMASGLPVLKLGDSTIIQQGDYAAAMGNPLGYQFSMVEGVVSARRDVDGQNMLQLAMPIERGNSGGPVLNQTGEVTGIVTLKSGGTSNLGFAMPVESLKELLAHPSPVAMKNWLTIGALNPATWVPHGAHWTQRAGVITAEGSDAGSFGGRAQCYYQPAPPSIPYEMSVKVQLNDETGAAGLAFCGDGADVHYGFYPTNGSLRLTFFQGPDVSSWTILAQVVAPAWLPDQWNELRVRIEHERILCYVNGSLVITHAGATHCTGRAGLCKFRTTRPQFRDFRLGLKALREEAASPDVLEAIADLADGDPVTPTIMDTLIREPMVTRAVVEREAVALEKRASALRRTAATVHERAVAGELAALLNTEPLPENGLTRAALLLSHLDNPDVDVAVQLEEIDRMTAMLKASLAKDEISDREKTLLALHRWMFAENGFHGGKDDANHRSNSYLNEVINDREGLPITLCLVHREFARRLGLDVTGRNFQGRCMNHLTLPGNPPRDVYIDVFDGGKILTRDEASSLLLELNGELPTDDAWTPVSGSDVILRMLNNLTANANQAGDESRILRYLDTALTIAPDAVGQRLHRLRLHALHKRKDALKEDAAWFFQNAPPGVNLESLRALTSEP